MDSIMNNFMMAYEYARVFSSCCKVKVGAVLHDESSNKRIFGANQGLTTETRCITSGECYKAKVSGIYESTEATRHLCHAVHAECNLLDRLSHSRKMNLDTSVLYVTRYPCESCAKRIAESGIKRIRYAGVQKISDTVSKILEDASIEVSHFPDLDFENSHKNEWWTTTLYNNAYEIVKDRKFPVTIPCYNRPSLPTLRNLGVANYTDDCNWDFLLIVRESQYEMYHEATKQYKYVQIVTFPDAVIDSAGAARRTMQKWLYSHGYKGTFQMDDDVEMITYALPGVRKDGFSKTTYATHVQSPRVLAMWQIMSEYAFDVDDACMTCGMPVGFSWKSEYCMSYGSYRPLFGACTQVVCFNIPKLCNEGLFHRNNRLVGFDDIDFTIRMIESGNLMVGFPSIVYGVEALGGGEGNVIPFEKLQERFINNQTKLRALHEDKPYVSYRVKRDLDQVCISWQRARKYLAENHGYDINRFTNMLQNVWDNGSLLNKARENSYK